jgi:hypothetical protein
MLQENGTVVLSGLYQAYASFVFGCSFGAF